MRSCASRSPSDIDVVSDGETSKISYATYIKDRLTGFGGDHPRQIARDLQAFPEFRTRMAVFAGKQSLQAARRASARSQSIERDVAARTICATCGRAVQRIAAHEAFMNAASPGVVSAFQPNAYYPTHEAYVEAIAEAMREEYEAIVAAGFVLQVDCPDLAMARHTGFQDSDGGAVPEARRTSGRGAEPRAAQRPAELAAACICAGATTKGRTITTSRWKDPADRAEGQAGGDPVRGRQSAARARVDGVARREDPGGQDPVPGLLTSTSNYVEHPELIAQRLCRSPISSGASA